MAGMGKVIAGAAEIAGGIALAATSGGAAGTWLTAHGISVATLSTTLITAGAGVDLDSIGTLPLTDEPKVDLAFGTLHFLTCGRRRLIACSDGAGYMGTGVAHPGTFIKAHQAGRYTFLGTVGMVNIGLLGGNPDCYVSTAIEKICQIAEIRDSPEQLLSMVEHVMGQAIDALHERGVINDSFRHRNDAAKFRMITLFEAFAIKRAPNSTVDLMSVRFPLNVNPDGSVWPGKPITTVVKADHIPTEPFWFSAGHAIPPDAMNLLPNPDQMLTDAEIVDRVDKVFNIAENSGLHIGPPYDVAVIDSYGFRWLRRQPQRTVASLAMAAKLNEEKGVVGQFENAYS